MILDQTGQSIVLDGVTFAVGMDVKSNANSDYANLYGVVTEIRTDDDRDTDNDTPDIYCRFDPPVMPEAVQEMEERFSQLYGMPKRIEDIALDMVIMAPDTLEPLDDLEKDRILLPVYVVIDDWCVCAEAGHDEYPYTKLEDAQRRFHKLLAIEQDEGCLAQWKVNDDYVVDAGEDYYECWLDGEYCENHYKLSIEQRMLTADKSFVQRLMDEGRRLKGAAC